MIFLGRIVRHCNSEIPSVGHSLFPLDCAPYTASNITNYGLCIILLVCPLGG